MDGHGTVRHVNHVLILIADAQIIEHVRCALMDILKLRDLLQEDSDKVLLIVVNHVLIFTPILMLTYQTGLGSTKN